MNDDTRFLLKVATLYYKNDLTHNEIAERLGVSRQRVGRALQQARDLGMVRIEILSPVVYEAELETLLETRFGLQEAIVVAPYFDNDEAVKDAIGKGAAEFLERRVRSGNIIGMAWSTTVYQVVLQMQPCSTRDTTVVGLIGHANGTSPTHAEFIVHRMAELCGGIPMLLGVPMVVERRDIKDSLLSDTRIARVVELASVCDIAVFGIGDLSPQSSPYKAGYVTEEALEQLRYEGSVGDVCGRFINADGTPHISDLNERTIAIEFHDLRTRKLSVALAGGARKVDPILGALRGGYCNVLVTDAKTARLVLERDGVTTPDTNN